MVVLEDLQQGPAAAILCQFPCQCHAWHRMMGHVWVWALVSCPDVLTGWHAVCCPLQAEFVQRCMWEGAITRGFTKQELGVLKAPLVYAEIMSYIKVGGRARAVGSCGQVCLAVDALPGVVAIHAMEMLIRSLVWASLLGGL